MPHTEHEAAAHRERARSAILRTAAGACASFASASPEATQWIVGFSSAAFETLWRAMERGISSQRLRTIVLRAMQAAIDRELTEDSPTTLREVEDDE